MKYDYLKILYNKKVDLSNYYTKSEVNSAISSHTIDLSGYYTKTDIDNLLSQYAKITSVPNMSNYVKYGDYVYFRNANMYDTNNNTIMSCAGGASKDKIEDGNYNLYFAIKKF